MKKHEVDPSGNALNDAGWEFINACSNLGIKLDAKQWNNCKQGIVRPVIEAYLKSANLATTEPMRVEEVKKELRVMGWDEIANQDHYEPLVNLIADLTAQGFRVDERKTLTIDWPEHSSSAVVQFRGGSPNGAWVMPNVTIPRPAPKTRQMTREEKIDQLSNEGAYCVWFHKLSDSTIDDLCKAAGINTEVEA
jgi:hypothetical protein